MKTANPSWFSLSVVVVNHFAESATVPEPCWRIINGHFPGDCGR